MVFALACHGALGRVSSAPPADRPAPDSLAEVSAWRSVEWILSCNQLHARRHPESGFAATLAELGPGRFGCIDDRLALGHKHGYRFSYHAGVPDTSGARRAFTLCALPLTSPHRGRLTVVSDGSGRIAGRRSTDPVAPRECARAWLDDPSGHFGLIQHCAIDYAEKHPDRGYPDTVSLMGPQGTGCLAAGGDATHVGHAFLRTRDRVYAYRGEAPRADGIVDRYSVYAHPRELSTVRPNPVQFSDETGVVRRPGAPPDARDAPRLASPDKGTPRQPNDRPQDRELLERSCAQGSAEDCHRAALLLPGTEPSDLERRARLPGGACGAGHGAGCTELGHLLGTGLVGHDLRASGAAATAGSEARVRADREPVRADAARLKEAVAARALRQAEYYERGCGLGDAGGCLALAKRLDNASETLRVGRLATPGSRDTTTLLSVPDPLRTHRDHSRILELYEHACSAGLAEGCLAAARIHETAGDRIRSARLWGKACQQDGVLGCSEYGGRLLAGDGVTEDTASGLRLLEKVCHATPDVGCSGLAEAYLRLRPPRVRQAGELLDMLCERFREFSARREHFCGRRDQVGSP